MRLTGTGAVVLATAAGLFVLGWWTTDNLLVLVGLVLGAPLLADAFLGRRALAVVTVQRRLPAELFAGIVVRGGVDLSAVRGRVHVVDDVTGACCDAVTDGVTAADWHFVRRGPVALTGLSLSSRYPLGLVHHQRAVKQLLSVDVAPHPVRADLQRAPTADTDQQAHERSRLGDVHAVRPWNESDPVRSIHWRTSARRDDLVVIERAGEGGHMVVVEVFFATGSEWERALERATGSVLAALNEGDVLVVLDGTRMGPGRDGRFRAEVLRALASAPFR